MKDLYEASQGVEHPLSAFQTCTCGMQISAVEDGATNGKTPDTFACLCHNAVAMAAGLRIQSSMMCRADAAAVMQVVDTMATYVAIGVLPVTAVLETFSVHRLSAFSSFPLLSTQYLNHLVLASIKRLEELTTPKTVKLLFEAQEACHPKNTKVLTEPLANLRCLPDIQAQTFDALKRVWARVSGRISNFPYCNFLLGRPGSRDSAASCQTACGSSLLSYS